MNEQRNKAGIKTLTFLILGAMAHGVYADGYRNPPPTAEGIGKSGVNMVFVDDASAISYNPANLASQTNASFVVSTTFAKTENSYTNPFSPLGKVESQNSWAVLPNLYASMPIGDSGVVFGLGITTPFGQGIEWGAGDVFNGYIPLSLYEAEISLINFNPSVAFKLGENVSVGVGADVYYSQLDFKAVISSLPLPVPPAPFGAPAGVAEADGDDIGFGGNIGITWDMTDRQKLAFTYRSKVDLDYEGDLDVAAGPPFSSSDFGLEITYPSTIGLGYGIELTDTVRIETNIEWVEWSVNDTQTADLGANNAIYGGPLSIPQDWNDTFTFGLGGDWQISNSWVVRAGYAFIESPIPDSTISPILPDADRHALSMGAGYTIGGHAIDVAYTFSIYEDRSSTTSAYPGTYDIDSDLVGLTYSYSF